MLEFLQQIDGYTVWSTFTNPPQIYWVGRDAKPLGRQNVEDALATATAWQRYAAQEVLSWTWYRRPGTLLGVPVDARRFAEMVQWVIEGGDASGIEISPARWGEIAALVARGTDGRIALLAGLEPREPDQEPFRPLSDFVPCERHHMFGPPQDVLWFDEDGSGPIDGIEYMVQAFNVGEGIAPRIELVPHGLNAGAGFMTPEQGRELARQLIAASDWAESRSSDGEKPGALVVPRGGQ